MRLRIKPTDDTVIQKLDCDGNWQDWFDGKTDEDNVIARARQGLGGYINEPSIPSSGSGECREYDLVIPANQQILLPIPIDSGDLITITNGKGSASDGVFVFGVGAWYFPSGNLQQFGVEQPTTSTPGYVADPIPTDEPHMSLIMNIGGIWYPAYNADNFEVPSGVIQENLVFQANDETLYDNVGSWNVHIKVCKATGEGFWTKILYFNIDEQGFELGDPSGGSGSGGIYTSGVGFQTAGGNNAEVLWVKRTFATAHKFIYMKTSVQTDSPVTGGDGIDSWLAGNVNHHNGFTAGIEHIVAYDLSVDDFVEGDTVGFVVSGGFGDNVTTVYQMELRGIGPNPFLE